MKEIKNLSENIIVLSFRGGLALGGATIMIQTLNKAANIFTHISNTCSANPKCLNEAILITDIIGIFAGGIFGLVISKKIIK